MFPNCGSSEREFSSTEVSNIPGTLLTLFSLLFSFFNVSQLLFHDIPLFPAIKESKLEAEEATTIVKKYVHNLIR